MSRLPPKPIDDRSKYMTKEQVTEYTHNSFKSIRAALNRHLQGPGRDMGIIRGKEFRGSNTVLDAKLKKKIARRIRKANKTYTIFC
jgi:hypothetical protein